ncbi:MAG: glycosyltransferase [Candidatus Bathyarchaeota archaeon]|nr:glycosyltransferase [Candidatus Bathyarchaeota archaeon]
MLSPMQTLLLTSMFAAGILVCIFSLNTYVLLYFNRRKESRKAERNNVEWPMVTIQIPTYNEKNVIERTLGSCLDLDYPEERLEIVVIDDSTDETTDIIKTYEDRYSPRIKAIHRRTREGYKAGALNVAGKYSQGEYFLILDADTMPCKDFLKKAIPLFLEDEKLGFIQGKIEYLNAESSWLTRSLVLANDWYRTFSQSALSKGGMFLSFLGHGGIFRRSAIEDAGGWRSDTITEDMDLSYRVQMRGWKSLYVEDARCVEEVPSSYFAAIQQYNRHMKGPIQNLRKHASKILKAKGITPLKKSEALIQMAYPLSYFLGLLCVAVTALMYLFLPGDFLRSFWLSPVGILLSVFMLVTFPYVSLLTSFYLPALLIVLSVPLLYLIIVRKSDAAAAKHPGSLLGVTLIWNDNMLTATKALIEILMRRKAEWTRTPKLGKGPKLPAKQLGKSGDLSNKAREAASRALSATLMIICLATIMQRGFLIYSFGLLLPAVGWIASAYLIFRSP